jgi:NADH dehydrogenase [ubiquinone] 1 alpha subcomplex assembly factor 7
LAALKISHFIDEALFNKDRGYYRKKNPLVDFITAPEISQVFGELLASYLLQISSTKNSKISLVEMGAGKGTLFFDILSSIKKLAEKNIAPALDFIERTTFRIIEINEVLRKIQQEKLREFNVNWHEDFADFLSKKSGEIFFISNELFDCFPIDQFVKTDIGWCERLVDGEKFITANFDLAIQQFIEKELGITQSETAPFGAVFEHSKSAQAFMAQLCEALKTQGGIAINFDYGYVKNEFANTLQALKNHKKVDVLKDVGNCDITAHVDFAALDKISKKYGLNSSIISQAEFLQSLGISERRNNLTAKNPAQAAEINSAIDRLIAPDQMGDLFKSHIIWK